MLPTYCTTQSTAVSKPNPTHMVLFLLARLDLEDAAVKVLMSKLRRVLAQRKHARLDAHRLELGAVHVLCRARELLKAAVS